MTGRGRGRTMKRRCGGNGSSGDSRICSQKRKREEESPPFVMRPRPKINQDFLASSDDASRGAARGPGTSRWEVINMDEKQLGDPLREIYHFKPRDELESGEEDNVATNAWNVSWTAVDEEISRLDPPFQVELETDEEDNCIENGDVDSDFEDGGSAPEHSNDVVQSEQNDLPPSAIKFNFMDEAPGTSQKLQQEMVKVLGKPPLPPNAKEKLLQIREQRAKKNGDIPPHHSLEPKRVESLTNLLLQNKSLHQDPRSRPLILRGSPTLALPPSFTRPEKSRKPSVFQRIKSMFQSKKETAASNREEAQRQMTERNARRVEGVERRRNNFHAFNRRTAFNQPIMSHRIERMLEKIESSKLSAANRK